MLARDAAVGVVVVQIGARVRLGWLEFQQVAARRGGDGLGRSLRVAGRGEIDDERLAAGGGGRGGFGRGGLAATGGEAQKHQRADQQGDDLFHDGTSLVVDGRDPVVDGLVWCAQRCVVEVHVETGLHVRARAQCPHIPNRAAEPAAVRGKGIDSLAAEVVRGQKGAHGGGAGVPPDGRAEHDRIVAAQVDVHRFQLRQKALLDLPLALRDHVVIRAGVGHDGVDAGNVSADGGVDALGDALRVAAVRIVKDQRFHIAYLRIAYCFQVTVIIQHEADFRSSVKM